MKLASIRKYRWQLMPVASLALACCAVARQPPPDVAAARLYHAIAPTVSQPPSVITNTPLPDPAGEQPGPNWIKAGASPDEILWIHSPSVRRSGNIISVWELMNAKRGHRMLGRFDYKSAKVRIEYDCGIYKLHMASVRTYSGISGTGELIDEKDWDDNQWIDIVPDTGDESVANAICPINVGRLRH